MKGSSKGIEAEGKTKQKSKVVNINSDNKINPSHYKLPNGIEANDVTMFFGFNEGNVIKYVWRAGKKVGEYQLTDLKKAKWYLDNLIESLETEHAEKETVGAQVWPTSATNSKRAGEDAEAFHSVGPVSCGAACHSDCSDSDRSVCLSYGICPRHLYQDPIDT